MAHSLNPYIDCIKSSLQAALCITNFPSQTVERHNKPEVEVGTSQELVLNPLTVCRNENERMKIEPSINAVRISINFNKSDETESIISSRYMKFLTQRAEKFMVLRREPIEGFDISFLITNLEIEAMFRDKIIGFIVEFLKSIDKDIKQMKIDQNSRARTVVKNYLSDLAFSGAGN